MLDFWQWFEVAGLPAAGVWRTRDYLKLDLRPKSLSYQGVSGIV